MDWFVSPWNISTDTRLWCWSKRKSQRCEARWVLKMHLEAHFDFSATDKISDLCSSFPEPQLRSSANTLRTCQSIWTCQTVFLTFFKISLTWFGTFCVCRLPSLLKSQKVTFFSEIPTSQLLITDLMAVHTGSDTKPGLQLLQCARTRKSQHCFHSSVSEGQFVTFRIVSYKISLKCQPVDKDRNYTWNISGKKIGDPTIASLVNFFFMTSQRIRL